MKTLWLLVIVMLTALPAAAQESPEGCTAEQVNAVITILTEALAAVQAHVDGGDPAAALEAMQEISNAAQGVRALCDGLAFEGDGDDVLGPIPFPDGFYRVTFTSESFAHAGVEQMGGDCDFVPTVSVDDFEGGEGEAAFEFVGCVGLIEVTASAPWTLSFERLTVD